MKTQNIIQALRNQNAPAVKLAAFSTRFRHPASRLRRLRELMGRKYDPPATLRDALTLSTRADQWELSSPEADSPILWISPKDSRVDVWQGRQFLDHCGWYCDNYESETLETCAVILAPFPRLMFYGVLDSGDLRVYLDEWEAIDFSECQSSYDADAARGDAAREVIRCNDSTTRRKAEDEREYLRKEDLKMEIEENRATLKSLRHSIRALASELKQLCPSPMAGTFPAAAAALRQTLSGMLEERRELMATNTRLAGEI